MTNKKPACDPCRTSKLACDHEQPTCARCRRIKRADACIYRDKPFKRLKRNAASSPSDREAENHSDVIRGNGLVLDRTSDIGHHADTLFDNSPWTPALPNPGYIGPSSHARILDQIPLDEALAPDAESHKVSSDVASLIDQAAQQLHDLLLDREPGALQAIANFWREQGYTTVVAEEVTDVCIDSCGLLLQAKSTTSKNWSYDFIKLLYQNSNTQLPVRPSDTISDFTRQFTGERARLESFGIFLVALAKAALFVPFYPPLYTSQAQRFALRTTTIKLMDHCWALCESLNSLNILQLLLQYERFLIHNTIDGPQSLQNWRKMGDVISSVLALGYHELPAINIAPFLLRLRQRLFARTYSADKQTAVFLGRPPRLSKRFCTFQIPFQEHMAVFDSHMPGGSGDVWLPDAPLNQTAMTCWYALSAALQEETVELLRLKQAAASDWYQAAVALRIRVQGQWNALPSHFKLVGSLADTPDRSSVDRWHLVSIRLAHLQGRFMLDHLMLINVNLPDASMMALCHEILARVVEIIVHRDDVTGAGVAWKVAHHGLSAAGMAILGMLQPRQNRLTELVGIQRDIIQYLVILVAEMKRGRSTNTDNSSATLFRKAIHTIQSFLNSVKFSVDTTSKTVEAPQDHDLAVADDVFALFDTDTLQLDMDWWQTLGEHPFLSNEELVL